MCLDILEYTKVIPLKCLNGHYTVPQGHIHFFFGGGGAALNCT